VEKNICNFSIENRAKYIGPYQNTCKDCKNKTNERYRNTVPGFLKGLLKHARQNAKYRKADGREEAGTFDLTYEDLLNILKEQDNKCFYSNVPLKFTRKTDYQASIERIDPSKGYVRSNVVICCLEFNDAMQWTKGKIDEMYEILQQVHDCSDIDFCLNRKPQTIIQREQYDKSLFHQCNKCMEIKPHNQFNKNKSIGCKDCIKILDLQRMQNPRQSIFALLTQARSNSKKRSNKSTAAKRDLTIDLSFDDLVSIYKSQNGLCAYSGLPLKFGNSNEINWKISLERINQKIGYTKDNVCLICIEFNTADKSILYNDDSLGSSAWSKEKFDYIFKHISDSEV
jgi:hypothetical protein